MMTVTYSHFTNRACEIAHRMYLTRLSNDYTSLVWQNKKSSGNTSPQIHYACDHHSHFATLNVPHDTEQPRSLRWHLDINNHQRTRARKSASATRKLAFTLRQTHTCTSKVFYDTEQPRTLHRHRDVDNH